MLGTKWFLKLKLLSILFSMYGVGTDIVTISRIKQWVKDSIMLEKVFTSREREYCLSKTHPHKYLAAAFAIKEAFMKAVGTGWSSSMQWKDVEMISESGRVSIRLHNKAEEIYGRKKVFVSISCAGDLAVALVIILDGV